jgi:hypothetical protein
VPLPLPDVVTSVIHDVLVLAVHEQPAGAVIVTLVLPEVDPTFIVVVESAYVHVTNWNWLEMVLRPVPVGPTAATRDSYVPPGSGQDATCDEKSKRTLPSPSMAGLPMFTVWKGAEAPRRYNSKS